MRLAIVILLMPLCAIAAPPDRPSASAEAALPWGKTPPATVAYARAASIGAVGRQLFFDPGLSASGVMSCATCHDPAHGFGPTNPLSVQLGGPKRDKPGTRAVPGLTYGQFSPFFTEHYYESEDDGNEAIDQGPTGGKTWDGRVDRARDQAAIPLLAANEMANKDAAEVVAHVAAKPCAADLRRLYGERIFADTRKAFAAITEALEFFQQTPAEFSPFTSKYDAFLRHQTDLTQQEARGLATFNDPAKGNCAHCHKSQPSATGDLPVFTDYGLVAVGAPRNTAIPANADPSYFDLGACGPDRKDLAGRDDFCGLFKTPTLRNVALRPVFYHNGVFHSLEDAVSFYATRDTNPERWYPLDASGHVSKFNDLPEKYWENINDEPPFDRHAGDLPALSPDDVADIVAFLHTLTDGYQVPHEPPVAAATRTR